MRALTLRIALHSANEYRLTLLASDDGDAAHDVELASATIANPLALPQPPAGQKWATPDELTALLGGPAPKNQFTLPWAGNALNAVLESGPLAAAWQKELTEAHKRRKASTKPTLRVTLDVRPPELRPLPWELFIPTINKGPLAQFEWATFSRWHEAGIAPDAMTELKEPLRFLIIVGCKENDTVAWQEELHHLYALTAPRLHDIDFELFISHRVRQGPLLKRLAETIDEFKPHVVHFIGHGEAATAVAQSALLLHDTTDPDPKRHVSRPWRMSDIVNALSGAAPRVVVLNACRTADFAGNAGMFGIAEALLNDGVAAVVGMQGDIPSLSAAEFSSGFYGALLSGSPVDEAMGEGRKRIANLVGATERDWALPVLQHATPVDRVLTLGTTKGDGSALSVRCFVERRALRRSIRARAESADATAPHAGLLIVRGESTIGKTTLVKYALEGCLHRGRLVRYVSFDRMKSMNIIDVMRHIRGPKVDPANTPAIERTLYAKFGHFNDTVKALLSGNAQPDAAGDGEDDPSLRFVEGKGAAPATIEVAVEAFRKCLRDITATSPLVLALDDIGRPGLGEGISVEYFTKDEHAFAKTVLAPIAERKTELIGNVCCVVCASKDEEEAYALGNISAAVVPCDVPQMLSDDFDLLGREYVFQSVHPRVMNREQVDKIVNGLAPIVRNGPSFKPTAFELVRLSLGFVP